MLDGLLGRNGFSSKCKPLIKLTRTRIDVIRRRRGATQKFLKKDIADLLATGLEHNAFGRAEGLISELILSSCYDFIDHVCEILLEQLSAMQKQSDCPEECKEAVASLMFAAARFSDLPELRELRDIFQERYGSSLECNANQKLVQHISPKTPSMEQKLQLLQDVALEFSMRWDCSAFARRVISVPDAREGHDQPKAPAPPHNGRSTYGTPQVEEHDPKKDIAARSMKKMIEVNSQIKSREAFNNDVLHDSTGIEGHIQNQTKHTPRQCRELKFNNGNRSLSGSKPMYKIENYDASHKKVYMVDPMLGNIEPLSGEKANDKIEDHKQKAEQRVEESTPPTRVIKLANSPIYDKYDRSKNVIPSRKLPQEETDGLQLNFKRSIPPPYVKPRRSEGRSKLPDQFPGNGEDSGPFSDDRLERSRQSNAPQNNGGAVHLYMNEDYYKADDELPGDPTPRRKPPRRRHTKSSSGSDNGGEVRVIRRTATSRRTESSINGLQILFDDDHGQQRNQQKDEEEQMLDKLLLKHSKKDSSVAVAASELESPRSKGRIEFPVVHATESSHSGRATDMDMFGDKGRMQKHTARSVSLPREQMASSSCSSETRKVFTRAVSFNQEPSTPAKHVHPKLPDYDDLAARFAALRRGND